MILKAFLSRCPEEKKRALERFLPQSERARLDQLPSFTQEITPDGFSHEGMLEQVHWSWFLPTLKTYSPKEQKPFLAALDSTAAENLAQSLEIPLPSEEISDTARSFLRQILVNSLIGEEDRLLPIDYLPPTPLKGLLRLSKKELIKLINFLSLYDLSAELRQIVETKILKKIYSFLMEDEKKILKNSMTHKESLLFPRMNLDRWNGSKESFRLLLHRRGLSRLGAALSSQDPDFAWYICHQLDIGRGNSLFKLSGREAATEISDAVIRQIEELLANPDQLL